MQVQADDRGLALVQRVAAARAEVEKNVQRLEHARSALELVLAQVQVGRSDRERLHESAYARLQARLASLPVIEQAKGILMAQTGCGPDEAFTMLRQASQRTNVRVRDLAAQIVQRTTAQPRLRPIGPHAGGNGATRRADAN